MKKLNKKFFPLFLGLLLYSATQAAAYSFPTLTGAPGARSVGLGEAFSAISDDVTALHYNPASLLSLKHSQASIFYEKGVVNDTFGQIYLGIPHQSRSYGAFVSYYDEGVLSFYDSDKTIQLQGRKETTMGVGFGQSFSGLRVGVAAKYLSSQLIEGVSGQSWAIDAGTQLKIFEKQTLGLSVQNFGPALKISNESVPLPRNARLGITSPLRLMNQSMLVSAESQYDINQSRFIPALGSEVNVGPLAFRAGARWINSATEYAFGAGFGLSSFSIDYAFLIAPLVEGQHKFSVTAKFGGSSHGPTQIVSANERSHSEPSELAANTSLSPMHVYQVKEGESWESVAHKFYGRDEYSSRLKVVNRTFVNTDRDLEAGQRILIQPIEK